MSDPKYSLYVDVKVTRRQALHHVFDDRNELVFSSKYLTACLAYLIDRGELAFSLITETEVYYVDLHRVLQ